MDYRDIEWFALKMNRDHSVIFETASKYCILDSFVDYDGYSISSKGFLPTTNGEIGELSLKYSSCSHNEVSLLLWKLVTQLCLTL